MSRMVGLSIDSTSPSYNDDMPSDAAIAKFGLPVEKGTPLPRPICRECREGHVRFDDPTEAEHGASKAAWDHDAWEPDWITGTFTTTGTCENDPCGHKVAASGTYTVSEAKDSSGSFYQGSYYASYYVFHNFSPPLMLMQLPPAAPAQVQEGVGRAAAVLFADPGLAATALRLVVEQFLTTEGIPATTAKGGFISADQRIKTWKAQAPDRERIADLLLAAKWIGNAGTHRLTTLSVAEVLIGAGFLDEAFQTLFVRPHIDARAKAINDARGPVPPSGP